MSADSIKKNLDLINSELPSSVRLVAVSKFKPIEDVAAAYDAGQRTFAESRPQELKMKAESLPTDIKWHFIGHLQTNKIKMVVPYVELIHSVDSEKLLMEIEKYCLNNNLYCNVLLELHIASEETKQGFSCDEVIALLDSVAGQLKRVKICGLMGMASFTDDESLIRREFASLNSIFDLIKSKGYPFLQDFKIKSYGMTNDYRVAVEVGSNMVRIGTAIFGERNYQ